MEAGRILVAIGDVSLARVLALWLADALPGREITRSGALEAGPGDTVLFPPGDLPPSTAGDIVARGSRAIVLAPVPRPSEQEHYVAVGVHYVVMSVDNAALLSIVRHAGQDHASPMDSETAPSHRVSPNCSA